MSAITGIFYRDGRNVDEKQIKKMNDRLSHRGPDGSAIWCEGPVALGHQMLHTTPESLHEKLPFEEDGLVITADARIDNRKELSVKLEIEDKEEVSDSYFILKAYQKWGEKCPEELLGDFAFAIWDKNNEKLFCARDHMGVKPFYYYLDDDGFYFATEIKALFTIHEVPYELNEKKLVIYLMRLNIDKINTFYKDILTLIAAHSLEIDPHDHLVKKYWKLDPGLKIKMDTEDEYIKRFLEIFSESVNCRLRSIFSIGFELSGGLDSSSVVCMARKLLNNKNELGAEIDTYSFIFDDFPQVDERFFIDKVVTSGKINPHYIHSDKISPLENMEIILSYLEQPFYTPNMTIIWNTYKKMRDNKIRVILNGNGGDEVISHGKHYFRELAVTFKWLKLLKEIRGFSERVNDSFFKVFLYKVIVPFVPEYFRVPVRNLLGTTQEKYILDKDFADRFGGIEYLDKIMWDPIFSANTPRKYHYFIINRLSHQNILEMLDRTAAAFFIEPRYPFFDKRLVEFCYAIPNEMKFNLGWDRYLQRVAMENILPTEIQWRPLKKYFDPVYQRNLLMFERNLLNKIFSNKSSIMEFVDFDKMKKMYQKYLVNDGNEINIMDLNYIWLVSLLYVWLHESKIKENFI